MFSVCSRQFKRRWRRSFEMVCTICFRLLWLVLNLLGFSCLAVMSSNSFRKNNEDGMARTMDGGIWTYTPPCSHVLSETLSHRATTTLSFTDLRFF
ncbi:hypothetical protein Hdeb2414_s0020g00564641 [Helianthus debilis subsp. tardiflorus]